MASGRTWRGGPGLQGFRELTHFTIVTYGPFALREGVTAPRRSGVSPASAAPGGSDRTLLLERRLEQPRRAPDEARAEAQPARLRPAQAAGRGAGETQPRIRRHR